jgi:hypothetical protein
VEEQQMLICGLILSVTVPVLVGRQVIGKDKQEGVQDNLRSLA